MFLNKVLAKKILKIFFFGTFDALALWSAVTLYTQQAYTFLVILLIGTVLLNLTYLSEKHYPLKYIIPGTLFMLFLVVYPIFYTVYVSLTNYGTGNILSKDQVIQQLEERYYHPENATDYSYAAFINDDKDDYIILLKDNTGRLLLGQDGEIEEIAGNDSRLLDQDQDGVIEQIGGYRLLTRKEIFKNLAELQKIKLHAQGKVIQLKNFASFTEYIPQYNYRPEDDLIVNLKNGEEYFVEEGYFVSRQGERLEPGFRFFIGADNFWRLLQDKRISGPFLRVFIWTFQWAFLSVLTTFVLGMILAILLNDKFLRFRGLYRALLVIPYSIPAFISALVWRGLFDDTVGIINKLLQAVLGSGLPWLNDPFWAKTALIIINLWLGFPYMMLICLGALQSIPEENYEAAAIDGASGWQQFRYITLPMLLVSVGPLLIASFAFNFNNFVVIYLYNRGRPAMVGAQTPAGATDILISYTYRLSFESGRGADFGLASAVTIIIFLITALITWFNFRYTGALEEVKENV